MIRARTEPSLKEEAEKIFKELVLTATEAINLFYRQVKLHKDLPFEVVIPNETTLNVFQDTDRKKILLNVKIWKICLIKFP